MKMMTRVLPTAAVLAIVLASSPAEAAILTFDDISTDAVGLIPDGYGGFDWTEMGFIDGSQVYADGSGYENGVVSGSYVTFNNFAAVASAAAAPFDFNGAYLTGAWSNGLNIEVRGFLGAVLLYDQTVVVNTTGPTFFNFNYLGIDRVQFRSFGGVDAEFEPFGDHFAMDNFTFNEQVVPEPASLLLLGSGLAVVARRVRRRS